MTRILEYKPVMSRVQRVVFWIMIPLLALLGANSLYLVAIPEANQNQFYLFMFLMHLVLGFLLLLPFLAFIVLHIKAAWGRENKRAIRAGLFLLVSTLILLGTGVVMYLRLEYARESSPANELIYWAHVLTPLSAVMLYVVHRKAGPKVHWNWGFAWGVCVALFVGGMSLMHNHDPRLWNQVGSPEGERYFEPSQTRTVSGKFIPQEALMMDQYCMKCHQDAYEGWFHSAHRFSSFNNPAYRFSIRETRKVSAQFDENGIPRGARWCAGCHDQVPFLSGKFDDPNYDDVNDPTAHAGITCTVCHAVTNINSTRGNGDYTIDEPIHYPFAYSDNPILQWVNNRLVEAKPLFHKKTFLKPFHRTTDFCSTCHKVSLPFEVNHYKEFLRGQNHHDPFLLSGVSGHGARSFYYPPKAKERCSSCHMPLQQSDDFGSKNFDGTGLTKIHGHLFPSANTGIAAMRGVDSVVQAHADFLTGKNPEVIGPSMRIDVFGLKEGGEVDRPLLGPIRPELPAIKPGTTYLVELVLRTLNVGHVFTQGTADSNEVWVDLTIKSGDRVIGRNGDIQEDKVDPWSHFINVLLLDRHGNRIDRRNPQDIFTPLYNHQLPPGAGQVVHYRLDVPADVAGPIEIVAKLNYRKFDRSYLDYIFGPAKGPALPVVTMCQDTVTLPVAGTSAAVAAQASTIMPEWQRWNDYGIGLLLEGNEGAEKGELRQAEEAFKQVAKVEPRQGLVNLARVYIKEGRLEEATEVLQRAEKVDPPADWWTVAWLNGTVNKQNGRLEAAIENFETIISNPVPERGFDFSKDYIVLNELGLTLFERAKQERGDARKSARDRWIARAIDTFRKVLAIDTEDLTAHYNLALCYRMLGVASVVSADGRAAEDTLVGETSPATDAVKPPLQDEPTFIAAIETILHSDRSPESMKQFQSEVSAYVDARRAANQRTLPILRKLNQLVREHWVNAIGTTPPEAATVLSDLHMREYLVYKPDDNARDSAIAVYRAKHPAANHAAQSIVIYPLTDDARQALERRYQPIATTNNQPPASPDAEGTK